MQDFDDMMMMMMMMVEVVAVFLHSTSSFVVTKWFPWKEIIENINFHKILNAENIKLFKKHSFVFHMIYNGTDE